MSLEQFITKLLNLKESDLQELVSLEKSDESIEFKLKLKPKPNVILFIASVLLRKTVRRSPQIVIPL